MTKEGWISVGMIVLPIAIILGTIAAGREVNRQRKEEATAKVAAQPSSPPAPLCLKGRKLHVHGTYRQRYGTAGTGNWADIDQPVDLTVEECLEWEVPKP